MNKSRGNLFVRYVLLDNVESKKSRLNFNLATVKSVLSQNPRNSPAGLGTNMKNGLNKLFYLDKDVNWHVSVIK